MPTFDLEAELEATPPTKHRRASLFEHPMVAKWLDRLLAMKAQGHTITQVYIAEMLSRGCRAEGLIGPDESIAPSTVGLWLRQNHRG